MAGFPEAKFQISPNGWINTDVFMSWLRDCFVPAVAHKRKPVVLFVDGHTSHTSNIEVIDLCIEEQILLYCLKSHASHIIQPLDQSLFGAMKQAWGEQCQKVMNQTGESISVRTFTAALKPVWDATTRPEVAFNGFAKSGIYPYNPERVVHADKLAPSRTFSTAPRAAATAPPPVAVTAPRAAATAPPPAAAPSPPPV
ncbi:uncharacterized protein LOC101853055 [Aplysia californica]|uniref:Uncharacterized protein LOC101853055 n=1 Tax=Aplysia californica TaxID=6500 RepID=A0ABM0JDY5_APLCA|nr:uncharacterized protein LOC101853055 [Aplysia californica]